MSDEIIWDEEFDPEEAKKVTHESYQRYKKERTNKKRKLAAMDIVNEVGAAPVPTPEILAERKFYEDNYVEMHQKIFKNSTGIKPFGQVQIDSIQHTHHALTYGGRVVIAEPRGFGKTTRTSNNALAAILQGKIRYALIIAASVAKASDILEGIKTELIDNEELARLYPAVCACFQHLDEKVQRAKHQTYNGHPTYIGYSKDKIRFPYIEGEPFAGSIIQVRSKDNVRGVNTKLRYGPDSGRVLRPDFVFLDDIQTDEEAESPPVVTKIVRTIKKSILFAGGHSKRLSAVKCCTPIAAGDVATHFLLNEPSWQVVTYKMMERMPDNMEIWLGEYAKILNDFDKSELGGYTRAAIRAMEFYRENREEMDRGAIPSWEWAYGWDESPITELSATQHAMNFLIREGEESFQSECQCNVVIDSNNDAKVKATPQEILAKVHSQERYTCPINCRHIVTHIDVNDNILTYVTVASPEIIEPFIIDYGTYPRQSGAYWAKSKLLSSMREVYKDIPEPQLRVYQGVKDFLDSFGDMVYRREDGVQFQNNLIVIDANGRWHEYILRAVRESKFRHIIIPSYGRFYAAKDKPMSEQSFSAACMKHHHCVTTPSSDRMGTSLSVDVNYFKTKVHEGWKTRFGMPTSISLFPEEWPGQHNLLADHHQTEEPTQDFWEKENRTVYIWKDSKKHDNEFFDNLTNALAGLCKLGCQFKTQTGAVNKQYDINAYLKQQKKM